MKRFFIVAGEASGDMHAARLMNALKQHYALRGEQCSFEGIGGAGMEAEGLRSLARLADVNVVGFWEVAKRYRFFTQLLDRCHQTLIAGGFDAFIPVDYPGFNLRLVAFVKQSNADLWATTRPHVCWYIAPQLWAWGAGRSTRLRASVDRLLVVFPFEVEFFRAHSIHATFVGHPLMDAPEFAAAPPPLSGRGTNGKTIIALLPGSRKQEIERNLPLFLEAAQILHSRANHTTFCVAAASHLDERLYDSTKRYPFEISLTNDARSLMKSASAGIVKTGTSTLEAALLGMPFAMAYRTSAVTYHIAKRKITLPHIALANIVAAKPDSALVVREFIQHEAKPHAIAQELERLLNDTPYTAQMLEDFAGIRTTLGAAGAANRAAQEIVSFLEQ